MTNAAGNPSLPVTPAPRRGLSSITLIWVMVAALVLTGAAISGGLLALRPDSVELWRAFMVAAVVSFAAGAVGLFPILLVRKGQPAQICFGFVAGSGLRAMVAIAGILLAEKAHVAPLKPSMLMMLAFVLAMLTGEVLSLTSQMRRLFPFVPKPRIAGSSGMSPTVAI